MNRVRVDLEGTCNTRDLGGYSINDNKVTRFNMLLRSDKLSNLTSDDIKILTDDYKVSRVIDLRSDVEIKEDTSKLEDVFIKHVHINLSESANPVEIIKKASKVTLGAFYIEVIENSKDLVAEVINEVLELKEGESFIFNCTAGKDRTGITAMMILGICGVSKSDILANYSVSEIYLANDEEFQRGIEKSKVSYAKMLNEEDINNLLGSKCEYIEMAYDHIINNFNSFENYFNELKIDKDKIKIFKRNFLD